MTNILYSILLIAPVVFILLLLTSHSERTRRIFSFALIVFSFNSWMMILLLHWYVPRFIMKGTLVESYGLSVTDIFVKPIAVFLSSELLVVSYMLFIILAGFGANAYARRKIKAQQVED